MSLMDMLDLRILDAMQRDADGPRDDLAERVGTSVPSLHRRLRRLRETGIVQGIVAKIDAKALGGTMTFIVGLEIDRKSPDLYAQLKRWVAREDSVQQAYNVTGGHDFVLIICARSVADYDDLMDRMVAAHANIKKYHTNVVLNTFKRGMFVPVLTTGLTG